VHTACGMPWYGFFDGGGGGLSTWGGRVPAASDRRRLSTVCRAARRRVSCVMQGTEVAARRGLSYCPPCEATLGLSPGATALISSAVPLFERKLTSTNAHSPLSHHPEHAAPLICLFNMWRTYYYNTKLAFVGDANNYIGSQEEIQVHGGNPAATSYGEHLTVPPRRDNNDNGRTLNAPTAPTSTPFQPSRRAFLRGALPQRTLLSGHRSSTGAGAIPGNGEEAVTEWPAGLAACGVLAAGVAPQSGGSAAVAAAVTSATGLPHAPLLSGPQVGGMARRSSQPPPPLRRRPISTAPAIGTPVGGAAENTPTYSYGATNSGGIVVGMGQRPVRGVGGASGEPAGSSAAHARRIPIYDGAAASASARTRGVGGCFRVPPGSTAPTARGAGTSFGGAAGGSAAHARASGSLIGGSTGTGTPTVGGKNGGDMSDEEMLDTPLSSLPRRPRPGGMATSIGARVSRVPRRPRAATPRGTPSPSPTRRRRQNPSTPRANATVDGGQRSPDGPTLADLLSTCSLGFASVRREVTALKRELALTNTQQRSGINKMDSMAVMVENVVSLVSSNRDMVLELRDRVSAMSSLPPSQGSAAAPPSAALEPNGEAEDAAWIVQLRPVPVRWLQHNFANARCASEVWPMSATINEYLQTKIAKIMGVSPVRAASMLQDKWRLPVRVKKNAQPEAPDAAVRTVAAKRKTPAYRFLHRGVSNFYQRIGITAVGTFSSRMHSEESLGTLRRVRGTRTKFEVVFSPTEATDMLANDTFILDAGCRAALMQAAHAVFDRMRFRNFSEPGPSRGGPRNVVCRLAHIALVCLKVRQHLQMRAAPVDEYGNAVLPAGLNVGHRDEWRKEMGTLSVLLAVQSDRAVNGQRITDGEWPGRAMADLAPPPPVLGYSESGDGGDGEDGDDADAGNNGGDGDDGDDEDGDATGGDGDGGDNGAPDDWVADINEEMHPGDDEEPPEGEEGVEELDARVDEDGEPSAAYRAARAEERREFEDAHAERRLRALARPAEMVRLRAAQEAAQRAIANDGATAEECEA